jgi:lycopene cyclase domain-containing protein
MNSHYTYLLLNLLSVLFPFILSFDKKVAFYKSWKYLFPAILINGAFFIIWDILFTANNVWSFNNDYILGYYILNLPFEEVLFFLCVPYSCLFIYEVLNAYINKDLLRVYAKQISILILILSFTTCIIYYDKTYTLVNAGICFLTVLFGTFIYKFKNMGRFYMAYFVSLIPFLICDGIITGLPIVFYNDQENMAMRLFVIPIEDVFYCLSMFLCTVLLADYFKKRKKIIA